MNEGYVLLAALVGFAGLNALGLGAVLRALRSGAERYAQRIVRTPTTPIAAARGGMVELYGRITQSEQGLVRSPLSKREGVLYRIYVYRLVRRKRGGYHSKQIHVERQQLEFMLDDGSGALACVDASGASFVMPDRDALARSSDPMTSVPGFRDVPPPSPEMRAWVRNRIGRELPRLLLVEELVLQPGQSLYALGPSQMGATPSGETMLTLRAKSDGQSELLLSNQDEQKLVKRLTETSRFGMGCIWVGLAIFVVGLVLLAIGLAPLVI